MGVVFSAGVWYYNIREREEPKLWWIQTYHLKKSDSPPLARDYKDDTAWVSDTLPTIKFSKKLKKRLTKTPKSVKI